MCIAYVSIPRCTTGVNARTARVLVLLVVPGQLLFILLIYSIEPHSKSVEITPLFAVLYIAAAIVQVIVLRLLGLRKLVINNTTGG